jgi:hypothetical protein
MSPAYRAAALYAAIFSRRRVKNSARLPFTIA